MKVTIALMVLIVVAMIAGALVVDRTRAASIARMQQRKPVDAFAAQKAEACAIVRAMRRQRCAHEAIDIACAHAPKLPLVLQFEGHALFDGRHACDDLQLNARAAVGDHFYSVELEHLEGRVFRYRSSITERNADPNLLVTAMCGSCEDDLLRLPDGGWEPAHGDTASEL